ncbi:MAG TPA: hypothetical protein VF937_16915 [Chloroflexota bacterium]
MSDAAGLGALALTTAEWLALGWLSGLGFPQPGKAAAVASWTLRLLVGACVLAVGQLGLALVGPGFGSAPLVLGLAGLCALGLRLALSGGRLALPRPKEASGAKAPVRAREVVGWGVLASLLLAADVRSLLVPEAGWDAYSHWGLRAQAYAVAGTIVNAGSEHEYYPPLVPLLEAWLYLQRGAVSIDLGKTLWAVFGDGFAVCLGWYLRLWLRSPWLAPFVAAGIVLATPALMEGFWTGQADLALTAYLSLAVLALIQWRRSPEPVWLVQAAVFGTAVALTKFEGLPRLGVVVLALAIDLLMAREAPQAPTVGRVQSWRPVVVLMGAAAVGWGLWSLFELTHGIAPNAEHLGVPQLQATGSVLVALAGVFGGIRTGGGLLIAALACVVSGRSILGDDLRPLTLVVVGQLAITVLAFLMSATAPEIEVRTSATRLFEQLMPLALFVGAVGLADGNL